MTSAFACDSGDLTVSPCYEHSVGESLGEKAQLDQRPRLLQAQLTVLVLLSLTSAVVTTGLLVIVHASLYDRVTKFNQEQ